MPIIQRKKLGDLVLENIRRHIIEHGLKTGDRLPTEQELADRFGVSRISVREATKALSFLGIIDAAPRRGLVVGGLDMSRVARCVGFHLAIADYPMEQLLEARIVIESGVLPHVMRRMAEDPGLYDRFRALAEAVERAGDLDERIAADAAFHRGLLDAGGVQPLLVFHDLLQVFFERFRRSLAGGDWVEAVKVHNRIIDALREGDLQSTTREVRQHIEFHRRNVERLTSTK